MRRTTGIIWILLVVAGQAAAQSRPATNLVTHSEVIIARSATAIWPWILDPSTWKHGAALSHRSGPIGGVGEVFAAYEPGDKAKVAFFVENVALATNRRRTIKLYSPTMALVGYAVWTLEEVSEIGRASCRERG